ncbi:S1 family peptidase [Streptomyces odontomachi]|uniref:S1 family peptidase n=1 Tax=Streptomyces odontomachi TaxID=2944940 RepID=UPI00210D5C0C|nr:S1 family peptidase [Streptomyces sp. ODS25]
MSRRPARRIPTTALVTGLLAAALTTAPQAVAHASTPASAQASAQDTTRGTGTGRADAGRLAAADAAVRKADVGGTAWYVDPARGALVVVADRTVGADRIARIEDAVQGTGGALEIRRTPGRIAERIAGGDPITTPDGLRCTVGFNVQDASGTKYALTAGHCTSASPDWPIGPVWSSSFPGNDYGLIRYTDPSQAEGGVRGPNGTLIDISDAASPGVGQQVCTAGRTTGYHCGTVLGLNATVNYGADGIVTGLADTNVCTESGDSGGPLFSGHTALGIASGGSGNCTSGGETFFQPVVEPLSAYGVMVF